MSGSGCSAPVEYREIGRLPGRRFGSDGSVWSQWRAGRLYPAGAWKKMKGKASQGYLLIHVGGGKRLFAHALVLEAFAGPRPPGMECRHLDGNPANNRLENLAWGTHAENHADAVRHGTASCLPENRKKGDWLAKLDARDAEQIRDMRSRGMIYREIAERFGVGISTVRRVAPAPCRVRLDDHTVEQIRAMRASGAVYREIAERFGVHLSTVWCVAKGRTHVRQAEAAS